MPLGTYNSCMILVTSVKHPDLGSLVGKRFHALPVTDKHVMRLKDGDFAQIPEGSCKIVGAEAFTAVERQDPVAAKRIRGSFSGFDPNSDWSLVLGPDQYIAD